MRQGGMCEDNANAKHQKSLQKHERHDDMCEDNADARHQRSLQKHQGQDDMCEDIANAEGGGKAVNNQTVTRL